MEQAYWFLFFLILAILIIYWILPRRLPVGHLSRPSYLYVFLLAWATLIAMLFSLWFSGPFPPTPHPYGAS